MSVNAAIKIVSSTVEFWLCLTEFILGYKKYSESTYFASDLHAKVQVFSLSLIFKLWTVKHYRSASYKQDLLDNLKNVAVPGTGVALSFFAMNRIFALFLCYLLNPLICFFGAWHKAYTGANRDEFYELLGQYYVEHLLHPVDWFSLWRLNCRLVAYHAHVTASPEYKMEDKWTFLVQGKELGVPVSPFFDRIEGLVAKNKLIEGGMGIHFYRNAAFGGDWILQETLKNASWLNELLPARAPLSTMRIITTSSYSLSAAYPQAKGLSLLVATAMQQEEEDEGGVPSVTVSYSNGQTAHFKGAAGAQGAGRAGASSLLGRSLSHDHCEINDLHVSSSTDAGNGHHLMPLGAQDGASAVGKYITAQSAVLRLGRDGAATDHQSILFDVDIRTGVIQGGTTNSHWYELGLKGLDSPWNAPYTGLTHHTDTPCPEVKGRVVPNMAEALAIVRNAHYKMMAEVPIVGWDVAFTPSGVYLLEVNLSCNFFLGSFNLSEYLSLVNSFWLHLEKIEQLKGDPSASASHARTQYSRVNLKKGGE